MPFGGVGASGTGSRFGGPEANLEAFTETQWLTAPGSIPRTRSDPTVSVRTRSPVQPSTTPTTG